MSSLLLPALLTSVCALLYGNTSSLPCLCSVSVSAPVAAIECLPQLVFSSSFETPIVNGYQYQPSPSPPWTFHSLSGIGARGGPFDSDGTYAQYGFMQPAHGQPVQIDATLSTPLDVGEAYNLSLVVAARASTASQTASVLQVWVGRDQLVLNVGVSDQTWRPVWAQFIAESTAWHLSLMATPVDVVDQSVLVTNVQIVRVV